MSLFQSVLPLVGRFLLCLIFVMSGLGKIFDFGGTVEYMRSHGIPWPAFLLIVAIALELVGGISVIIGYWTRAGVLLLLLFLVPVSFSIHDFWTIEDPATQRIEMSLFMKNVSIAGGLIYLLQFGPGRFSLDSRSRPKAGRV